MTARGGKTTHCDCGGRWPDRDIEDYVAHLSDGRHQQTLKVSVCCNCFYGQCGACSRRRSLHWKCSCDHKYAKDALVGDEFLTVDEQIDMATAWQTFLVKGAPRTNTLDETFLLRESERNAIIRHFNRMYSAPAFVRR